MAEVLASLIEVLLGNMYGPHGHRGRYRAGRGR
ncbi:hypothetical protein [Fournierella massiliensis]